MSTAQRRSATKTRRAAAPKTEDVVQAEAVSEKARAGSSTSRPPKPAPVKEVDPAKPRSGLSTRMERIRKLIQDTWSEIKKITWPDGDTVRRLTALLSHQSYLYESLTARENLDVFADHLGVPRNVALLERVGLSARADDAVSTFSAGMRKRLSFARVLLQEPRVVLLDEPYGQLDPPGFALVDEVVRELKSRGTTVLMATHQLERGGKLADDAIVLEEGRVR